MKITFFAAKTYDRESFGQIRMDYPELELEYWETELSPKPPLMLPILRPSAPLSARMWEPRCWRFWHPGG